MTAELRSVSGLTIACLAAALLAAPCAQAQNPGADKAKITPAPASVKPAAAKKAAAASGTEAGDLKSKGSYGIGVSMGTQLRGAGLTPETVSTERLFQGLRDALSGKAKMSAAEQQNIMAYVQSVQKTIGDTNHAAARKFLAENGKKKDIVTTASGLQYHVITPGGGDSPKPTDQVTVNYRGTLLDGTEFDSSYKRGEPATFPVNGVIPGWQEALVLMKPGAKWQLFVPPELAYDMRSPPAIPPGSMLIFDVEMIKVNPPAPPAGTPGAGTPGAAAPGAGAHPAPTSPPKPQ
jgi:FKBP-type peptidyl-prolyl cis-trans isomerase